MSCGPHGPTRFLRFNSVKAKVPKVLSGSGADQLGTMPAAVEIPSFDIDADDALDLRRIIWIAHALRAAAGDHSRGSGGHQGVAGANAIVHRFPGGAFERRAIVTRLHAAWGKAAAGFNF
jgi:hypothetical protein